MTAIEIFLYYTAVFYTIYLILYATFLCLGVIIGSYRLYNSNRMKKIQNELKHEFYFPVSILIPAYNEEVTIVDTVVSLMNLDYNLYEIIVVDDGSKDNTSKVLIDSFQMEKVNKPIRKKIPCQPHEAVYEVKKDNVKITLIRKKNGGKGDALNMGINASESPYFLCIDADSMLQRDSLENVVKPLLEDESIIAVGGVIRIAQCVNIENGEIIKYQMPWRPIIGVQVMEYIRSFFTSRILMDGFNGNLIISGAFGLFKKDIVIAVGGYATDTLGEDMELVVKMHLFCKNNNIKYAMKYEPSAVCWSQSPNRLSDLITQRRRWHLGLFQCMMKYRQVFGKIRFGMISFISYIYYLLYELFSPMIEVFGIGVTLLGYWMNELNFGFMLEFFLLYSMYNMVLTLTVFFQQLYIHNIKVTPMEILKALSMCALENIFFRYVISFIRITSFIGYKKRKKQWGQIKRTKQNESLHL